jgi:hypothetical protein
MLTGNLEAEDISSAFLFYFYEFVNLGKQAVPTAIGGAKPPPLF